MITCITTNPKAKKTTCSVAVDLGELTFPEVDSHETRSSLQQIQPPHIRHPPTPTTPTQNFTTTSLHYSTWIIRSHSFHNRQVYQSNNLLPRSTKIKRRGPYGSVVERVTRIRKQASPRSQPENPRYPSLWRYVPSDTL